MTTFLYTILKLSEVILLSERIKRKWNRRILIAESLLTLHLTYVKNKNSNIWFCMDDILDLWERGIIPTGLKRSANMTDQELSNRLKSIWALNCVESEYRDYHWVMSGTPRRKRQVYFRVTDEEELRNYIVQSRERRNAL